MITRGRNSRAVHGMRGAGWSALIALVLGVSAAPSHAQTVYFAQDDAGASSDQVFSADFAGGDTGSTIEIGAGAKLDPKDVVNDAARGRVFWTESGKILVVPATSPDATPSVVLDGLGDVTSLDVLERDGSLIYVEDGTIWLLRRGNDTPKSVSQFIANKSGGSVVVDGARLVCVDGRTVYWTEAAGRIGRASKQGGFSASIIVEGASSPSGIVCDPVRDALYWTELGTNAVYRSDLQGNGIVEFLSSFGGQPLDTPTDVIVDRVNGEVFVSDSMGNRIVAVGPDGTELEQLDTEGVPLGLGISTSGRPMELGNLSPFGKPGSVLVWPYVSSRAGETLITVTNTNGSHEFCGVGAGIYEGTVRIKFLFVRKAENGDIGDLCLVDNAIITLTPNDTFSVFLDEFTGLTSAEDDGWLLAAAVSAVDSSETGLPQMIDYDWLIGSAQIYQPETNAVWGYDAYTFRGLTPYDAEYEDRDDCGHAFTDDYEDCDRTGTSNGRIDFDDREYDAFPLVNSIPRIQEQPDGGTIASFLATMATNRGPGDESEVVVRIFNNIEDRFSGINYDIRCLEFGDLVDDFSMNIVEDLEGGPDPNGFPEQENVGWMTMFIDEPYDEDTPAILSVFAQLNLNPSGPWVSGNNAWTEPAIFMRKQQTSFLLDLEDE